MKVLDVSLLSCSNKRLWRDDTMLGPFQCLCSSRIVSVTCADVKHSVQNVCHGRGIVLSSQRVSIVGYQITVACLRKITFSLLRFRRHYVLYCMMRLSFCIGDVFDTSHCINVSFASIMLAKLSRIYDGLRMCQYRFWWLKFDRIWQTWSSAFQIFFKNTVYPLFRFNCSRLELETNSFSSCNVS